MTSTDRLNEYAYPTELRMAKGVDGGIGREDSFFGPWKILTLSIMGAFFVFTIIYAIIKGNAIYFFELNAIAAVVDFFAIRYIVLEEKKYDKLFAASHYEESQPAEIFDNVMRLSGDNRESISFMYMGTGETCLAIQIQHGSIVGKGLQYEEIYYDTLSDALRLLIKNDYTVIRKQMMINCRDDPRLALLRKKEVKLDNSSVKELIRDELGYLMSISAEVQYENEYWFIYTKKAANEEVFMSDVTRAVSLLKTVARLSHICTKGELYALAQAEFGCPNATLGEKHSATALGMRELGNLGVYLSAVNLGDYILQEAHLQSYYGGAEDKFAKVAAVPDALQVEGMLKEVESKLGDAKVLGLKDALYAKYIVNSNVYKQSLVDSLANMDWSDEDED